VFALFSFANSAFDRRKLLSMPETVEHEMRFGTEEGLAKSKIYYYIE